MTPHPKAIATDDPETAPMRSLEPEDSGERVKILLVDDQPENLLSAEAVLESLGQEIIKAESGREALRQVLKHDFAVILLDIMMPGMDGLETAQLIREREKSKHTPIIFLTALGRSEDHVRKGYGLGAVDYLMKPFVSDILRSKVSVFVELYRQSNLARKHAELLEKEVQRSKRAEEEIGALNRHLENRLDELAAVNHELETFSYTVSHDLRGPLGRIAGFAQALRESQFDRLDERGKLYLERIETSSRRMNDLVEDLLNFSRLTRMEMRLTTIDLSTLVNDMASEIAAREPERLVEFRVEAGLTARADADLIRAVIQNLLENAWKFTRRHLTACIEFGALPGHGGPTFFVRDDGAGFDMECAGRLFQPFQRLHEPKQFEGTGIGLATVDRIIKRHGGRIWAESAIEQGATFFFTLHKEAA